MASICSQTFTIELTVGADCTFGFGSSPANTTRDAQEIAIDDLPVSAGLSVPFAYTLGGDVNSGHANAGFFIDAVAGSYPANVTVSGTFTPANPDWNAEPFAIRTAAYDGTVTIASGYSGGNQTFDIRIGLNTGV